MKRQMRGAKLNAIRGDSVKARDRRFHIRLELNDEGGYTVTVPELQGCVTEGDTLEEALEMVKDAMIGLLTVKAEYGDPIPPQFEGMLEEFRVKSK